MSVTSIEELRARRRGLVEDMRRIVDAAEGEDRDFSGEETQEYENLQAADNELKSRIERQEALEGIEPKLDRSTAVPDSEDRQVEDEERAAEEVRPTATPEYADAFRAYMRGGLVNCSPEQRAALQVNTDSEGGYTVADEWARKLVESLREFGVVRQLATVITTAESGDLHIPKVATDGTAALTAEEAAYTESEDTFGEVVLNSYKLGTLIKISDELLHDSIFDLDGFIQGRAAQAIGIKENNYFTVGTDSGQPQGLDKNTVGKTTAGVAAVTADELIDLYHSLLAPYRRNAAFIFADSTVKAIRKLKDGQSQYLWQPGLQAGQPDLLLGKPVYTDPDWPVMATGNEFGVFGDIAANYWIRDVEGLSVKVLNELYAANGQVGYRVSRRSDGAIIDGNAARVINNA